MPSAEAVSESFQLGRPLAIESWDADSRCRVVRRIDGIQSRANVSKATQFTRCVRIMIFPMSIRTLIAPCALLALGACLVEQTIAAQSGNFRQRYEGVLAQHGVVGGGIAIVHGQSAATQLSFGWARQDTRQPVDSETAYNWASITKTLTAIAILQLRDRGQLSLDDPAVRYVPELRQVHDDYGSVDAITVRDLLTHSAGFRNPTWPWDCDDVSNCD